MCTTQQEMPPLIATEFLIRVADILAGVPALSGDARGPAADLTRCIYARYFRRMSSPQTARPFGVTLDLTHYPLSVPFAEYFEECKASLVKAHFVTVYQLLDEMMDSGMPTTTETNILKARAARKGSAENNFGEVPSPDPLCGGCPPRLKPACSASLAPRRR